MSKAIVPLVIGLAILTASSVLAVWNEQRTASAADLRRSVQAEVVDVPADRAPTDLEGGIVHVTGDVTATGNAIDPVLGKSFTVLRLDRLVETAQWQEEKIITQGGRDLTYRLVWSSEHIDSSSFQDGGGAHPNPPLRLTNASFPAPSLHVGIWTADARTWQALPATAQVDLPDSVPVTGLGRFVHHGGWWWSGSPDGPVPGDIRFHYAAAPLGKVSLIGKVISHEIIALADPSGNRLAFAAPGNVTVAEMLGQAAGSSTLESWKGRAFALTGFLLGGFILAFALEKSGVLGRLGVGIPGAGSVIGPALWLAVSAGAWLVLRAG